MMDGCHEEGPLDRNGKITSAAFLSVIRNRRGHRPPESNRPGDTVIASYNVHKCIGVDRRFDPERTASVIAEIDADIIAVQEADKRFGERSGLLNLEMLERDCGLVPVPITIVPGTMTKEEIIAAT